MSEPSPGKGSSKKKRKANGSKNHRRKRKRRIPPIEVTKAEPRTAKLRFTGNMKKTPDSPK
jgi:hypothetical protein